MVPESPTLPFMLPRCSRILVLVLVPVPMRGEEWAIKGGGNVGGTWGKRPGHGMKIYLITAFCVSFLFSRILWTLSCNRN